MSFIMIQGILKKHMKEKRKWHKTRTQRGRGVSSRFK